MDVLIPMYFSSYGSEHHPISNISRLLHAQVSSFPNFVFHVYQTLTNWGRAINPLKIVSEFVFSAPFSRESMSMLMVMDPSQQNQQRSYTIGVFSLLLRIKWKMCIEKI
jgi:hypothetical protein